MSAKQLTSKHIFQRAIEEGLRREGITTAEVLGRVANRVAEHEREECARACEALANRLVFTADLTGSIRAQVSKEQADLFVKAIRSRDPCVQTGYQGFHDAED